MTLKTKAKENLDVLEHFVAIKQNISAVTGRAYYAVFQRIKHYLQEHQFDYGAFLAENNYDEREKEFSHGTIRLALQTYLLTTKRIEFRDAAAFMIMDDLYRKRIIGDYRNELIGQRDGEDCLIKAKHLIGIMDGLT